MTLGETAPGSPSSSSAPFTLGQITADSDFHIITADGLNITAAQASRIPIDNRAIAITGKGSAVITLPNGNKFSIQPHSRVTLDQFVYNPVMQPPESGIHDAAVKDLNAQLKGAPSIAPQDACTEQVSITKELAQCQEEYRKCLDSSSDRMFESAARCHENVEDEPEAPPSAGALCNLTAAGLDSGRRKECEANLAACNYKIAKADRDQKSHCSAARNPSDTPSK